MARIPKRPRDLRSALASAGEAGPFVLVGHSLGGSFIRDVAAQFRVRSPRG